MIGLRGNGHGVKVSPGTTTATSSTADPVDSATLFSSARVVVKSAIFSRRSRIAGRAGRPSVRVAAGRPNELDPEDHSGARHRCGGARAGSSDSLGPTPTPGDRAGGDRIPEALPPQAKGDRPHEKPQAGPALAGPVSPPSVLHARVQPIDLDTVLRLAGVQNPELNLRPSASDRVGGPAAARRGAVSALDQSGHELRHSCRQSPAIQR